MGNLSVLMGSMLVSPIGGKILNAAMDGASTHDVVIHTVCALVIPVVVGCVGAVGAQRGDLALLDTESFNPYANWAVFLGVLLVACMCGVVLPISSAVPKVGVDIATQILPPICACGMLLARSEWMKAMAALLIFATYAAALYISARAATHFAC